MSGVSARRYADEALELLGKLTEDTQEVLEEAADLIAPRVADGGIIQAFGTGHSQAAALEIAGRAGGLIPTNRIALSDLVHHGGEPPSILADPLLERAPDLAARLLDLVELEAHDVFVIASNSGINRSVVDMALEVTRRGFPLVAITSVAHTGAVESRHPTGKHLADLADVVIDNHAPPGDTILATDDDRGVCAVSSVTTAFVIQMLVAEIVRRLEHAGTEPLVYVSANTPGGHERNVEIESRYGDRLRRFAM